MMPSAPLVASIALSVSLTACLAALIVTPVVIRLAHALRWVDRPDGVRKLHVAPVPRTGGLAVFGAFAAAYLVYGALLPLEDRLAEVGLSRAFLLACGGIVLLGLLDDIRGVTPWAKIAVQTSLAICLYYRGFRMSVVNHPFSDTPLDLGGLGLPLTVLWFVLLSNAFNLIDGLDGLAAGVACFATSAVAIAAFVNGRLTAALLAAALAGALLGFLRYNYDPARIFLGDSGALFVGFALAGLSLRGSTKASAAIAIAMPMLVLAVPMLDVGVAVLRRTARGVHIFRADRDHIHHRLLLLGLTPRRAVLVLYGATAFASSLALMTLMGRFQVAAAALALALLAAWAGVRRLGYVEVTEIERSLLRRFTPRSRNFANNVLLRDLRARLEKVESLPAGWSLLGESLAWLGFSEMRLELRDAESRRRAAALASDAGLAGFPVMTLSEPVGERGWSWTFELPDGSRTIGELVLTWPQRHRPICFESHLLAEAVLETLPGLLTRSGLDDASQPSA